MGSVCGDYPLPRQIGALCKTDQQKDCSSIKQKQKLKKEKDSPAANRNSPGHDSSSGEHTSLHL